MDFTQQEKEKIMSFLAELRCPVCGRTRFDSTDSVSQIIVAKEDEGKIDLDKPEYLRALCTSCKSCGYVMQFNLRYIPGLSHL